MPLLLNSLLFACIIYFGASYLDEGIEWLTSKWPWIEWLSWLLWPIFAIAIILVVFFCFSIVANLIAAPFNGFLSQAVSRHLTGITSDQNSDESKLSEQILDAFKSEAHKLFYFLVRAIPLLFLFFIPFVQAFAPIIWFMFGAWMLALEYMEYPMGNQGILFPQVRATLLESRAMSMGFGGSVLLLTMIPVLNFLDYCVVAAATKLWLERISLNSDIGTEVTK